MQLTQAVLVITVMLLVMYDLYIAGDKGYKATISYVVMTDSKLYPVIAFACGFLAGHIWWGQCP